MSQLIFSQAKSIRKKATKYADSLFSYTDNPELHQQAYDTILNIERNEFKEILYIAKQLHDDFSDITNRVIKNWYFITIRPDSKRITFHEFYKLVDKFIKRKCFIEYSLSFEQKGLSIETLGTGFHVHIVANTKHNSKGQCLRDTVSSFKSCTADNCIEVKPTREPIKIIDKYLKEYESEDGHKEITKEWDKLWRQQLNLSEIYEGPLSDSEGLQPLITVVDTLSSSPGQGVSITNCPLKLDLS